MIIKKCEICNQSFTAYPSRIEIGHDRFCSIKCKSIWQAETMRGKESQSKGYHHTEDARMRMGAAARERQLGKKLSESHKKNLSLSHIGLLMGEKHPQWKGEDASRMEIESVVYAEIIIGLTIGGKNACK